MPENPVVKAESKASRRKREKADAQQTPELSSNSATDAEPISTNAVPTPPVRPCIECEEVGKHKPWCATGDRLSKNG